MTPACHPTAIVGEGASPLTPLTRGLARKGRSRRSRGVISDAEFEQRKDEIQR